MTDLQSTSVKKLISDLASEGFSFHNDFEVIDEYRFGKLYKKRNLQNVVFEKEGVSIKIYTDLFFRITGLSYAFDEILQKPVKVTDDEFYEMQKLLIRHSYEQQKKRLKTSENQIPPLQSKENQ